MLRTDLALEAKEMYHEKAADVTEIDGVKATTTEKEGVIITHVEVLNKKGSESIGKDVGNYYTFEIPDFKETGYAYYYHATHLVSECLQNIFPDIKNKTVLVVGLGNRQITSDALGPFSVDKLIVTRHLHQYIPESAKGLGSLCSIVPNVLAQTGIESAEIIKSVCEKIKPDVVIAIDALASRKTERVGTTIQISDAGIKPGAGIGNHRKEISQKTLNIPVIAIGVPMVVDVMTVAHDIVEEITPESKELLFNIKQKKQDTNALFTVTPKDVDKLTHQMANIISAALNITLHDIDIDDIDSYIS